MVGTRARNVSPQRFGQLLASLFLLLFTLCAQATEWAYTVRPGDNLWNFTDKFLADQSYLPRVQKYNNIPDPDYLLPGSTLSVPVQWLKVQPVSATLTNISGTVEVTRANGTVDRTPNEGAALNVGDSVRTQDKSSAVVRFADDSHVLVHPGTSITLDAISTYDESGMIDTSFRLRGGRVENTVNPGKEESTRFRVITPPAIAAVKGTEFSVFYNAAEDLTGAEVDSGLIGIEAGGVEVDVPAGFGSVTKLGEPPGEPRERLTAPDLTGLPNTVGATTIAFRWTPTQQAKAYLVQLRGENNAVQTIQTVDDTFIRFAPLAAGEYAMDVSAIDSLGLLGDSATHRFRVISKPKTPTLLKPGNNTLLGDTDIVLTWQRDRASTLVFNVQVSDSPDFTTLLLSSRSVAGDSLSLNSPFPAGTYHWRVAGFSKQGETSDWSDAFSFTVIDRPAAPIITGISAGHESLLVEWEPVNNAIAYEVEIARNSAFDLTLITQQITGLSYNVQDLSAGKYYVRVRSVGQLNTRSALSDIVAVDVPSYLLRMGIVAIVFTVIVGLVLLMLRRR